VAGEVIRNGWSEALAEHTRDFVSGNDVSSAEVDSEMAMKYSAVSACVRVRAETFASVPFLVYRKVKDGREPVDEKAPEEIQLFADMLHARPNEEMAAFTFQETLQTNFDVAGNSICERLYNKSGQLVGLYPYNHACVRIERNKETKKLEYHIKEGTETKTLSRDQVLHIPNLSFDGIVGLSPISYAARSIMLGLSYETYGVNFYRNAAMPSGMFEASGSVSEQAFTRLKEDLKNNYTGLTKAGTPMLLEEGMKWQQVTINPVDAQLLESKYFQIEDIARIYRVPQHLINKLDRSTNNNIEHQSLEFAMYCMLPIFKRDESCMNAQIVRPEWRRQGYYVEAKMDGLLRGDAKSRAEAYAAGRQWGWLSVNDIRKLENMPGIGAQGDIYLTPANMIDSSKMDQQQAAQNYARLVDEIYNLITTKGGK
jgi:HK97 family phage portal protein